jgi:hypothetical protein
MTDQIHLSSLEARLLNSITNLGGLGITKSQRQVATLDLMNLSLTFS